MDSTLITFEGAIELSPNELLYTNGGQAPPSPWCLVGLWLAYLLEHQDSLVDGVVDGWNELTGTIF